MPEINQRELDALRRLAVAAQDILVTLDALRHYYAQPDVRTVAGQQRLETLEELRDQQQDALGAALQDLRLACSDF